MVKMIILLWIFYHSFLKILYSHTLVRLCQKCPHVQSFAYVFYIVITASMKECSLSAARRVKIYFNSYEVIHLELSG